MPGALFVYQALHDFTPSEQTSDPDDEEIQIEKGDTLEVKGPIDNFEHPNIWLKGKNVTKGTEGLFPGTFVQFIKTIEQSEEPVEGKYYRMIQYDSYLCKFTDIRLIEKI